MIASGNQFTSFEFTQLLTGNGIAISMDGEGAWRDNVFVERIWRSVKYEAVYIRAYDSVGEARRLIGRYFEFYNGKRPHSSLDRKTPDHVYFQDMPQIGISGKHPAEDPLIFRRFLSEQTRPPLSTAVLQHAEENECIAQAVAARRECSTQVMKARFDRAISGGDLPINTDTDSLARFYTAGSGVEQKIEGKCQGFVRTYVPAWGNGAVAQAMLRTLGSARFTVFLA